MYLNNYDKVFYNYQYYNQKGEGISSLGSNGECFIQAGEYEHAGEINEQIGCDATENTG